MEGHRQARDTLLKVEVAAGHYTDRKVEGGAIFVFGQDDGKGGRLGLGEGKWEVWTPQLLQLEVQSPSRENMIT